MVPAALTVNSTTNYTIAGAGKIAGSESIVKLGSSTLTISTTNNTYNGAVTISGGTLLVNNSNALGSATTTVTVTNGGDAGRRRSGLRRQHGAHHGSEADFHFRHGRQQQWLHCQQQYQRAG